MIELYSRQFKDGKEWQEFADKQKLLSPEFNHKLEFASGEFVQSYLDDTENETLKPYIIGAEYFYSDKELLLIHRDGTETKSPIGAPCARCIIIAKNNGRVEFLFAPTAVQEEKANAK